jgi:CBS domain-containing protein
MNVRDVMSAPVFTVGGDTPFAEVVEELLAHDVSGAPVVDDSGHVIGVVSEADLISNEAYGSTRRGALAFISAFLHDRDPQWLRKASGRTARELMNAAPLTTTPDEPLSAVALEMLETRHKRVPVIEDGELVGIVTRHDLLRAL